MIPDIPSSIAKLGRIFERTLFSGIYIAFIVFVPLIFPSPLKTDPLVDYSFFGILLLPGMLIAHLNYEIVRPAIHRFLKKSMVRGFRKKAGEQTSICSYSDLQEWRNNYLDCKDSGYFVRRITESIEIRRWLHYLSSSALISIIMLWIGVKFLGANPLVSNILIWVSVYVFIACLAGLWNRYHILGETIGMAYTTKEDSN